MTKSIECSAGHDETRAMKRLVNAIETLVNAHACLTLAEVDPRVQGAMLEACPSDGIVVRGIKSGQRHIHLIGISELYRRSNSECVSRLKLAARQLAAKIIIVHERTLLRQPRLDNCDLAIRGHRHLRFSERMKVWLHLVEEGGVSTILDCARLLGGDDPMGGVLGLCVDGMLHIDLNRRLTPHTIVSLSD